MSSRTTPWRGFALVKGMAVLLLVPAGCSKATPQVAAPNPPEVVTALPTVKEVTEYEDFTGRTEAIMSVDLRSRVSGYLDQAPFKEGSDVKKGALLFEIDPRTYKAEVERAEATLKQNEAQAERLAGDAQRAKTLTRTRSISVEEAERIQGDRAVAAAAARASKASLRMAKLNLEFTRITAPFSGRISRRLADPGNLIKADETVLTSIVVLDPIQAYFDLDERTVLRLRRLIQKGEVQSARSNEITVRLGLADETGFSLTGVIDFIDNKLDAGTGTLRIRVKIPNKKLLLSPGMFLRLRLPIGSPHKAILVPEEALVSDQGNKFLYVLDKDDKARSRRVELGQLQNGMRVIKGGLKAGEQIVVSGQQRVRNGIKVTPKPTKP